VPLFGNGLNAYFGIRNWDAGTWGANIIGGGNLSGGNIGFTGGAAGQFVTGQSGIGSLSGTAAGTAISYPVSNDVTAPTLGFETKPDAFTNIDTATFTLSSDKAGTIYRYSFDGGSYAVSNGVINRTGLSEGQHTVAVAGADPVGNLSLTSYTWTTDYRPPTIILTGNQPPPFTNMTDDINFGTTESEPVTYAYKLDGAAFGKNVLTRSDLLSDKSYSFEIDATDRAGNMTAKLFSWTVDTLPPAITLSNVPPHSPMSPRPASGLQSRISIRTGKTTS